MVELGEERCLISAVVGVWCRAETLFKVLLTLASGQTPASVAHLRAGERGTVRLKGLNTFHWTGGEKYPCNSRRPLSLGPLSTYSREIFINELFTRGKNVEDRVKETNCGERRWTERTRCLGHYLVNAPWEQTVLSLPQTNTLRHWLTRISWGGQWQLPRNNKQSCALFPLFTFIIWKLRKEAGKGQVSNFFVVFFCACNFRKNF